MPYHGGTIEGSDDATAPHDHQRDVPDLEKSRMPYYVGIISNSNDFWRVRFPDVPGCVRGAPTAEEAVIAATRALSDVMEFRRSGGVAIPLKSSLSAVLASGEVGEGEHTVLIPLLLDSGHTLRANVTFDSGLLEAIDAEASRRGVTRSAFLASAARDKIIEGGSVPLGLGCSPPQASLKRSSRSDPVR